MPLDPDFAALGAQAAPSAAVAQTASPGLDADFAALTPTPTAPAGAPDYSVKGWAKFLGNEGARIGAKAVAGLPLMAMDLGVGTRNILGDAYNKVAGNPATPDYQLPSSQFNQMLDSYTTAPTSGLGKATELLGSAVTGGKLPTPTIANAAPAAFAPAAAKAASNLTGAQQQALQAGEALGMRATPGQQIGSHALQQVEAKLESQPWTSGPLAAIASNNATVVNRAAAKSIGEDSSLVDSTVLSRAADRISNVFQSVRNPGTVVAQDPKVTSDALNGIESEFSGLLPTKLADNPLVAQLKGLTDSGSINGQQLGQLSSKLGKAAYKQMSSPSGDRDMGQALYQVKDHVDDLLESTLSGADAATYAAARSQYRNLMLLMKPGVTNTSTGNVSGKVLANTLARTDKNGYILGGNQSDLYNAARFSQAFKPVVGDSGTATRAMGGLMPILGSALGSIGGHVSGHGAVEGAGAGALAAPALLNLASRAYLKGAVPATRGVAAVPGLIQPAAKPALYGGLLAAQ